MRERIVKSDLKNTRYIVNSIDTSENTKMIIDKYNYLINTLKVNSNRILVFTLNRAQSEEIKRGVNFTHISSMRIGSFFSFIQKELSKYWPLVLDSCDKIEKKRLRPVFMTFEASQNLMTKLVEFFREKGKLNNLAMVEEEIAQKMLSNLGVLAFSNRNYMTFAKYMDMYNQGEFEMDKETYEDLNKLINIYVERVLAQGALDYALGVYLYTNYLLKNEKYKEKLKGEIDYIIVDKTELASPAQIDFISIMEEELEELCLVYNPNEAYGIYLQNTQYLDEVLWEKYFKIDIEQEDNEVGSMIEKNILYGKSYDIRECGKVEVDLDNDVSTEANRKILKKLEELRKDNPTLEGISIIAPSRDIALEYILSRYTKKNDIKLINLNRNERIIDNNYINALTTFAQLYYCFDDIVLTFDEMKLFFTLILDENIIKASLLVNYLERRSEKYRLIEIEDEKLRERLGEEFVGKYDEIRKFLSGIKGEKINIDGFFKEIYLKFYLDKEEGREVVQESKALIDSAANFIDAMTLFDAIKDINLEFLIFIRNGAKESENIYDIYDKLEAKGLIVASPVNYLNYNKRSKEIFLIDIRNNLWIMNSVNILQNPYVLTKGWDKKKKFNMDISLELETRAFANLIKRITNSVEEKFYFFGHRYSSIGIERESLFFDSIKET